MPAAGSSASTGTLRRPGGRPISLEDPRFEFVSDAYDVALWAMVEEGAGVDAILFDLGLSSFQIDEPDRGFHYIRRGTARHADGPDARVSRLPSS